MTWASEKRYKFAGQWSTIPCTLLWFWLLLPWWKPGQLSVTAQDSASLSWKKASGYTWMLPQLSLNTFQRCAPASTSPITRKFFITLTNVIENGTASSLMRHTRFVTLQDNLLALSVVYNHPFIGQWQERRLWILFKTLQVFLPLSVFHPCLAICGLVSTCQFFPSYWFIALWNHCVELWRIYHLFLRLSRKFFLLTQRRKKTSTRVFNAQMKICLRILYRTLWIQRNHSNSSFACVNSLFIRKSTSMPNAVKIAHMNVTTGPPLLPNLTVSNPLSRKMTKKKSINTLSSVNSWKKCTYYKKNYPHLFLTYYFTMDPCHNRRAMKSLPFQRAQRIQLSYSFSYKLVALDSIFRNMTALSLLAHGGQVHW